MNFQYFIYALLNILNQMSPYILLGFLLAGMLHVFVRPATMSRHLSGRGWKPVLKAALVGIPLPLCSCGVLPTAVAFRRQGASKGATTSFLIATPQTGVDSIAATYALLGLPFAIIRPIAALVGSFFGGVAVSAADDNGEDHAKHELKETVDPDSIECACSGEHSSDINHCCDDERVASRGLFGKLIAAVRYGFVDMVASVGKWLVIGLVVAAIITVAVPDSLFLSLAQYPLLAMLVMVAVAVPMYICATGSIPIALSLMLKGLTPGVGFVLLMAGPAANFASVMVLNKSLGKRATAIYVGSVIATALIFGLIIDYLLPGHWFAFSGTASSTAHCHVEWPWFPTACSALLVGLLLYAMYRSYKAKKYFNEQTKNNTIKTEEDMQTIFKVKGMSCAHCKATVEKAVGAVPGVENVAVDLATGKVAVNGAFDHSAVGEAVTAAGFEFLGKI